MRNFDIQSPSLLGVVSDCLTQISRGAIDIIVKALLGAINLGRWILAKCLIEVESVAADGVIFTVDILHPRSVVVSVLLQKALGLKFSNVKEVTVLVI